MCSAFSLFLIVYLHIFVSIFVSLCLCLCLPFKICSSFLTLRTHALAEKHLCQLLPESPTLSHRRGRFVERTDGNVATILRVLRIFLTVYHDGFARCSHHYCPVTAVYVQLGNAPASLRERSDMTLTWMLIPPGTAFLMLMFVCLSVCLSVCLPICFSWAASVQ